MFGLDHLDSDAALEAIVLSTVHNTLASLFDFLLDQITAALGFAFHTTSREFRRDFSSKQVEQVDGVASLAISVG
jgi:hypothetical protein